MSNGSEFQVVLGKRVKVLYADCLEETCQECVFNANGCCADCPCAGNDKNGKYAYFVDAEQLEEDLEAEIERWWNERYAKVDKNYKFDSTRGHYLDNETIINLARHFAEWGAEHLKR